MEENREPRNKLCIRSQLIFDKGAKNTQWGEDGLFNKWCWGSWISTGRRMKLDHYLIPLTKINSKQIKNLNVRPETMKLQEDNAEEKFLDIGLGDDLLDMTPKVQAQKQ